MVRHDKDGAFGLVINRPIAERPLAELLGMLGDKDAPVSGTIRIVRRRAGAARARLRGAQRRLSRRRRRIAIDGRMAVTSSREHPARHRHRQRPGQEHVRVRLRGLGARPARGRAQADSPGSPRRPTRSSCSTRTATRSGTSPTRSARKSYKKQRGKRMRFGRWHCVDAGRSGGALCRRRGRSAPGRRPRAPSG